MIERITVIIAAYNAKHFIERALSSALNQSCEPDIIIVDDASTDGTAEHVRTLIANQPRARLLVQTRNQGPSAARNRGLKAATTEWVTPLDADDAMEHDRLEKMLSLATFRGWDAIADDQYRITAWHAGAPRRRLWSDQDFGMVDLTLTRFVRENIMDYTGENRELGFIKPLMRRAFLEENDLGYNPAMRLGEDYDLYCNILARGGRFGLVDPQGYIAHDTPGSLSRRHRATDLKELVKADQRLLSKRAIAPEARQFIKQHLVFHQKKWAWACLREAYYERNLAKALSCFLARPVVLADLVHRLAKHAQKKLLPN